jgi:hypothetical protein
MSVLKGTKFKMLCSCTLSPVSSKLPFKQKTILLKMYEKWHKSKPIGIGEGNGPKLTLTPETLQDMPTRLK